ncbi:MAG TPA: hypothetical protein VFA45_05625, partial [Actinomycetes bacterium]|nr:hypothetical protein [Actinomycetes bacterium]
PLRGQPVKRLTSTLRGGIMARPSIETARQWAPKPLRDRLPTRRRSGLSARRRSGLSARLPGGLGSGGRGRPLQGPKAAIRRRRRRQRLQAKMPSMPSMPSKPSKRSRPSKPSVSMPSKPSKPSVSMLSISMPSVSVPKPPRRRRRRSRRLAGNLGMMLGACAGYVLGTKAGRERYQQIVQQARELWQRPQVQDTVAKGRDRVGSGVERAAATAGDRIRQARERTTTTTPSGGGSTGPTGPA